MSFSGDVERFAQKTQAKAQAAFVNTAVAVKGSIVDGSPVTASPGQPVDFGTLKASWQLMYESPTSALIATNLVYARGIEDGIGRYGPLQLRSAVGGFHSVKLTVAGFDRLLTAEAVKVAAT